MRGLEWAAIPVLIELLDVDDVEQFVRALVQIREHQLETERRKNATSRD